jgi:hypothetical protein
VHALNGHTGATAQSYYNKQHRDEHIARGREAWSAIGRGGVGGGGSGAAVAEDGGDDDAIAEDGGGGGAAAEDGGGGGAAAEDGGGRSDAAADCGMNDSWEDLLRDFAELPAETPPTRAAAASPVQQQPRPPAGRAPAQVARRSSTKIVIGEDHPDKDRGSHQRARWTSSEVTFVGNWVTADQAGSDRSNPVARCLKAILVNPAARALFHPNHVTDSGRLRAGYEKWKQQKKKAEDGEIEDEEVTDIAFV